MTTKQNSLLIPKDEPATSLFNFNEHQVRTHVDSKGTPWFVAADVCAALGIKNSRAALTKLDNDEKGVVTSDTLGGSQAVSTVNESGLYELAFVSRKPAAKEFKRWIKQDVLPALRKDGVYVTGEEHAITPEMSVEAIQAQLEAFQAYAAGLIKEKATRIEEERRRRHLEEKEARDDAFRVMRGKSPSWMLR